MWNSRWHAHENYIYRNVVDRIARSWQTHECHRDVNKTDKCVRFANASPLSTPIVVGVHDFSRRHSTMHFNDSSICHLALVVDRYRFEQSVLDIARNHSLAISRIGILFFSSFFFFKCVFTKYVCVHRNLSRKMMDYNRYWWIHFFPFNNIVYRFGFFEHSVRIILFFIKIIIVR